jgi:uncharacterized membrane protein
MPVWVHEWIVAPVALALVLRHATRALGPGRAVLEAAVLTAYGFGLEWAAMAIFSAYRYSSEWTVAPAGVPLAVAAMWAAIILAAMSLAVRSGARTALGRAAVAAALAIALDLLIEPVAHRLGLWRWTPPGPWLSVPLGNFVGWAVVVGGYTFGAERLMAGGSSARILTQRAALATASISGLVLVGWVWRSSGAESLFSSRLGWWCWGALVFAPVLLTIRRSAPAPAARPTLAVRLGQTSGPEPYLVFALVACAFVADAALIGGRDLMVVAFGTCVTLGLTFSPGASRPRSLSMARGVASDSSN